MIIVTARMESRPGHEAELSAAALAVVAATRAEPGCLSYTVLSDLSDPSAVVFVEEWADSAALRAHTATAHLRAFQDAARDHLAAQEIRLHTVEKSRTL